MAAAVIIRRKKRLINDVDIKFSARFKSFYLDILDSHQVLTPAEIHSMYIEEFGARKLNKKMYPSMISSLEDLVREQPHILKDKNYLPIVHGLEIEKFLLKKLTFSNTRNKLSTFQTLAILDLTVPDSSILPFTHSSNPSIRKASRTSYVALSNNDPFKFFDQADNSLNTWDSIALMQQLEMHHKNNLPNFSKWIKYSKNKSQLLFIIKAVGHFKQKSSASALVELLDTEDHDVRRETIIALGQMKITSAEATMIDIYPNQPIDCQDAIVEAILKMNSGEGLPFLKEAYSAASNFESKKLIAEVIFRYSPAGRRFLQQLLETETGFDKLILEHVKNPLVPSRLKINESEMDQSLTAIQ